MEQIYRQTISTRLEVKENKVFIEFFQYYEELYGQAFRVAFNKVPTMSQNELRMYISQRFGMNARMSISVVKDAIATYKSALATMKSNRDVLEQHIKNTATQIQKLVKKRRFAKNVKYIKYALYKKRQRLNRLNQKLQTLNRRIENNEVSVCFGSKALFKKQYTGYYKTHEAWLNAWRKARSHRFMYIGEKATKAGNQLCQFSQNQLKIRVPDHYNGGNTKYIYVDCPFRMDLSQYFGQTPIAYEFIKRDNKYYVHVTLTLKERVVTNQFNGTVGLDYNKGFITLCETDKQGNIIHFDEYRLKYHGTGNKAKTEIEQTLHKIVQYAKSVGKDIIYEKLDFKALKFKHDRTRKNKKRNRDLHLFDYSRYKTTLANIASRLGVGFKMIFPAYTSIVGEALYSKSKGISRHMAAAYVIARIGQGYNDVARHPELRKQK